MMVTVGITRVIISSQGHWCRYLYRPLTIRPWTRGGRQGSNRASLPLVSCHRRPPTRPPHPHTHPGTATPQLTMGLGRPSPRLRDLSGEKAEARALCGGRRGRGTEDGGCWQPPASPTSPTILKSPTIPQDPKAQALQTAIRRWPKMLFKTTLWRWSFVTWALIRFRWWYVENIQPQYMIFLMSHLLGVPSMFLPSRNEHLNQCKYTMNHYRSTPDWTYYISTRSLGAC